MSHTLYLHSSRAKKWSTQDLKKSGASRDFGERTRRANGGRALFELVRDALSGLKFDPSGRMIVPDGDVIHRYDPRTGEWTHIDAKDEK